MGCDIHMHIEVKIHGTWHHWSAPNVSRNYALFCRMAGVRGPIRDIKPIAAPRGLPKDISAPTKLAYEVEEPDAHSESWLDAKELADLIEWRDTLYVTEDFGAAMRVRSWEHGEIGYFCGNGWSQFAHQDPADPLPGGATDARLVFWFDN